MVLMVCSHCPTPRSIKRPIKVGCVGLLCVNVYAAQRQMPIQIPIGFCPNLLVSVSLSVSVSVSVLGSEHTMTKIV